MSRATRWCRRLIVAAAIAAIVPLVTIGPAAADNPWVRVPAPAPGATAVLKSVSCVTTTICTAVGTYDSAKTLIVRTDDGITWSRQPSPNPGPSNNQLESVSCTTPTDCTAVGISWFIRENQLAFDPLVVRTTDGATWQPVGGELADAWREATLWGVSCTAPTRCHAVGYVTRATRGPLLMRTTSGDFWSELPPPTMMKGTDHWLRAIDCVNTRNCTAVGHYRTGSSSIAPTHTLVLRTTNGQGFTLVPSPNSAPGSISSDLFDVSCTAATACTAVGTGSSASRALILRGRHGTTWTRAATPVSAGEWIMNGVSCKSVNQCTVVGVRSSNDVYAAMLRTSGLGTVWSSPDPTAERAGRIVEGVSCPAPKHCFAVGSYRPSAGGVVKAMILRET